METTLMFANPKETEHEKKIRHYRFKNSVSFESVEEAQRYINARGWIKPLQGERHHHRASDRKRFTTKQTCSDIIDGNCVAIETWRSDTDEHSYHAYFIGATGYVELIKAGEEHNRTFESLVAWLKSEEFRTHKLNFLTLNDLPTFENDEKEISKLASGRGNKNKRVHFLTAYRQHLKFMSALKEFEHKTLPNERIHELEAKVVEVQRQLRVANDHLDQHKGEGFYSRNGERIAALNAELTQLKGNQVALVTQIKKLLYVLSKCEGTDAWMEVEDAQFEARYLLTDLGLVDEQLLDMAKDDPSVLLTEDPMVTLNRMKKNAKSQEK